MERRHRQHTTAIADNNRVTMQILDEMRTLSAQMENVSITAGSRSQGAGARQAHAGDGLVAQNGSTCALTAQQLRALATFGKVMCGVKVRSPLPHVPLPLAWMARLPS